MVPIKSKTTEFENISAAFAAEYSMIELTHFLIMFEKTNPLSLSAFPIEK
jgi:hypothetical protein